MPMALTHPIRGRINIDVDTCLSTNGGLSALVVGGQERGARLLELESGAVVWKAKNLPPDPRMSLQQLMWTTLITILCLSGSRAGNGATMACWMGRGQVQIYNVRSSLSMRRPASTTPEGMLCHCMTALCQLGPGGGSCRGNVLAVGDAMHQKPCFV